MNPAQAIQCLNRVGPSGCQDQVVGARVIAGGSLPTLSSPKGGPLGAMINKTSDHADQSALRW